MTKIWPEKFRLNNKVAVVTGGAGLIGKKVVLGLAQAGASVLIAEFNKDKGVLLEEEYREAGLDVEYSFMDITKADSIAENINLASDKSNKGIDIWVNCAYPRTKDWANKFEEISLDSWRQNIDMQLNSLFLCCQKVAEEMKNRKTGNIINFGSTYGIVGPNFSIYEGTQMTCPGAYSAIKGGVIGLTKYLATYYSDCGIRVNAVSPGGVYDNQNPEFVKKYSEKTPLGRMANPEEIAGPVLFLASEASSYITGHVLMVDGGWTAW